MNLITQYTDEHYASKLEVKESLGIHCFDPIWNQLCEYRRTYMKGTDFVEFCLCPGILSKIISLYDGMHRLTCCEENSLESMLSSESLWMFHHYLKTDGNLAQRIHDVCLYFDFRKEKEIIALINTSELPEIVKIAGVIELCGKNEITVIFLAILLNHFGCQSILSVLCEDDLEMLSQKDGTYGLEYLLNSWTKRIRLKVEKGQMKQEKEMDSLVYQYPQLKEYQIQFYLNHHEPGFYYTIEQFIQCSGVCYETGRCALKQMVDLGFYQMFKQGKKFVYTAR